MIKKLKTVIRRSKKTKDDQAEVINEFKTSQFGTSQSRQTANASRKEILYSIMAILIFLAIIYFILTGGFGVIKQNAENETNKKNQNDAFGAVLPGLSKNYVATLPLLGLQDAKISFIEFGDFQCPFCAEFYRKAEKRLISDYALTGKIKAYYKDYPQTDIHDKAMIAAEAGRCANEQGKFWEMHNKLYEEQDNWGILAEPAAKEKFIEYAKNIGLDILKFNSCLSGNRYKNDINADITDGNAIGIIGTPAFLVSIPKNNVKLSDLNASASEVNGLLVEHGDYYTLIIQGVRGYNDFKSIFDTVTN